jgi:hypothetical protein
MKELCVSCGEEMEVSEGGFCIFCADEGGE